MRLYSDPFLNPIFKREVLAHLRAPWMRWVMGAYLILPFLALAWKWPENQVFYGGSSHSRQLIQVFFLSQFGLAALVYPVMGAFAISREKENRTYEFLFTTLMRPWTIGTAKLAAILMSGAILTLCSIPVLSFVFFLGGVDSDVILTACIVLTAEALLAGVVSLFFSATFKNGVMALFASFIALPILWYVLIRFLDGQNISGPLYSTSIFFLLSFCLSVFLWLVVIRLTRRPPEESVRRRVRIMDDDGKISVRRNAWPYYLIDPVKRPDPIADGSNPIIAKEQLTNLLFRSAWRWRCLYITITALLLAVLLLCVLSMTGVLGLDQYYSRRSYQLTLDEGMILLWLLSLLLAIGWAGLTHAVAFAGEQEGRTIEMLKLTQLTKKDFLRGKWLICLKLRWPYSVVMVGAFFFSLPSFVQGRHLRIDCIEMSPIECIVTALALIEVTALVATRAALFSKNTQNALLWTFGIIIGTIFLPYLAYEMFSRAPVVGWIYDNHFGLYGYWVVLGTWATICAPGILFRIHRLWQHDH